MANKSRSEIISDIVQTMIKSSAEKGPVMSKEEIAEAYNYLSKKIFGN
ncbi:hypothetical protein [Ornithinibacillus sp. JPR2-1]